MSGERVYTLQELLNFNGEDGPMYVAFKGLVYDVSRSRRWKSGIHENLHFPGQDLTNELIDAPHGQEVFTHPLVQLVGRLVHSK